MNELDIIIPVYNEGPSILSVLDSLGRSVKTSFRVLICYDNEDDTTVSALATYRSNFAVVLVRNSGNGPHAAVVSGFKASRAEALLVFPGDDTYNAPILDLMVEKYRQGSDIVCASRFMPGGVMEGCPFPKNFLVRSTALTLHTFARVPTKDPTNGFRLFSRRVVQQIAIESTRGFTYSLELLVKCHRLGWKISEVPAAWHERTTGKSRFRVMEWMAAYLRWYIYAFITTCFRRGPGTVPLKKSP